MSTDPDLTPYRGSDPMPAGHRRPTKEECLAAAGRAVAAAHERRESLDPHTAALAARRPNGPSVEEIEDLIRSQRGLPALDRSGPTDASPPTG